MQAIDGIQDQQSSLTMQSMAFRARGRPFPIEPLKWSRRKTVVFVAASSSVLWTAIFIAAWMVR